MTLQAFYCIVMAKGTAANTSFIGGHTYYTADQRTHFAPT
jgi:hypothetical protein